MLHSAFYYFDGLYELDFNNPPAIVTVIGLLLMFAGLFAMISGVAHTIQYFRKTDEKGYALTGLMKYNVLSGILILLIAYLYFIFTGPGLVDMTNKTMNNSIFVELIRNGNLVGFNFERILYVDSLVMIGINILLMGAIYGLYRKLKERYRNHIGSRFFLLSGVGVLVISFLRIPLYDVYLKAFEGGSYGRVLLLNWLVNKNNPIMPYLAFALLGMWLAALLKETSWEKMVKKVISVALVLLVSGVFAYLRLPDTMLERSIDPKWFAIMTAQMGLFLLMILFALWRFDFRKKKQGKTLGGIGRYLRRFGVAGLTPFFLESVVSASVYRFLRIIWPDIHFSIGNSLLYGFILAVLWGVFLQVWEKRQYRYGLEYGYTQLLKGFGRSEKESKMGEAA
jgi:hypothetical protein